MTATESTSATAALAVAGQAERPVRPPAAWLVRALVTLAKRELADANATCGECWPAGQEWHELGHTSQHAFMHRAREAAGIPHAEYRALIEAVVATDEAAALDALWVELERPTGREALPEADVTALSDYFDDEGARHSMAYSVDAVRACAAKVRAAERERLRATVRHHFSMTTMSLYGTQPECKAARDALQRLLDDLA